MNHKIQAVEPGSIAHQLGIQPGDELISINEQRVVDWIDYQAFCCQEQMRLLTRRGDEEIAYRFEKDEYEPLGLKFTTQLMSGIRNCCNKCLFCFVDQLPTNTRESMHVKDDDWRLSLMMGSYVTLTNVSDRELQRIIDRHASPLYISVHATDPELRSLLLGTPRAARLMDQLKQLARGGIQFHAQAVLCPGYNDGEALARTVKALSELYPACQSLALVPVGLTGHRQHLTPLRGFQKADADRVLDALEGWQRDFRERFGESFVHAADELYVLAGREPPPDAHYDGYLQIDNGIGLMRLLETEFSEAYEAADRKRAHPGRVAIATGVSAERFLRRLMERYPLPGVEVQICPVVNRFFGDSVSVTGLVTGGDLVGTMKDVSADRILITHTMLRRGEDVFLDGMSLSEARAALGGRLEVVGERGEDLLNALAGEKIVEDYGYGETFGGHCGPA
jgi:putative radical SAM enzyme (TIGR03279 family)